LYLLRRKFDTPEVRDVSRAVRTEIARVSAGGIGPGDTVAVTAGSRGITDIDVITRTVIDELKARGARPFIVPAMGSHGGGIAESQKEILAGLGITEEAMGCEIRSSMDVVEMGETPFGTKIYLDRAASEADLIVVINRIKPHTKFTGDVESGLLKMCLIGLGNREGASVYHRAAEFHSWKTVAESAGDIIVKKFPIAFGLAVLQNSSEKVGKIQALLPGEFQEGEPRLLIEARAMTASIPFSTIDLLIVDEMGKHISGTGMDSIVIGRKAGSPVNVSKVFVRDLADSSQGNAQGIGLADFTVRKLVEKIDFSSLYLNSRTACRTDTCKIPMTLNTDMEAVAAAVEISGCDDPSVYGIVWIKNTLELDTIIASESYLLEIQQMADAEIIAGPEEFSFNRDWNLIMPFGGRGW